MSWITIVWSMNATACLTLAGIYLVVWDKQREDWVYLAFSFTAVGRRSPRIRLALLRAQTTAQYAALLRWVHFPCGRCSCHWWFSCGSTSVPGDHGSLGVSVDCGHSLR